MKGLPVARAHIGTAKYGMCWREDNSTALYQLPCIPKSIERGIRPDMHAIWLSCQYQSLRRADMVCLCHFIVKALQRARQ